MDVDITWTADAEGSFNVPAVEGFDAMGLTADVQEAFLRHHETLLVRAAKHGRPQLARDRATILTTCARLHSARVTATAHVRKNWRAAMHNA